VDHDTLGVGHNDPFICRRSSIASQVARDLDSFVSRRIIVSKFLAFDVLSRAAMKIKKVSGHLNLVWQ
jgi:hypothetical protein